MYLAHHPLSSVPTYYVTYISTTIKKDKKGYYQKLSYRIISSATTTPLKFCDYFKNIKYIPPHYYGTLLTNYIS